LPTLHSKAAERTAPHDAQRQHVVEAGVRVQVPVLAWIDSARIDGWVPLLGSRPRPGWTSGIFAATNSGVAGLFPMTNSISSFSVRNPDITPLRVQG